jgi:hypothetical protein
MAVNGRRLRRHLLTRLCAWRLVFQRFSAPGFRLDRPSLVARQSFLAGALPFDRRQ